MAKLKRSSTARVALLGAAAFSLAACEEEKVKTSVYPTLASCVDASYQTTAEFTAAECEANFAKAKAEHERVAPRYAEADLCKEQHAGECTFVENTGTTASGGGGGGGFFMPMMMGYMVGNMMSGNSSSYRSQPLYKTKSGKFSTANGSTMLNSNKGVTQLRKSSFKAAPTATKAKPMTRASIKKTGGFGASRTSTRSSSRGFGGSRSFGG